VPQSQTRSKKLWWLIITLVILSVATASFAVYLVLRSTDGSGSGDKVAFSERRKPIFVEIEPFTINISSSSGASRLLYIGMTFKVGNEETREILEGYMPQVRSRLLMHLSDEKVDNFGGAEGKAKLAEDLMVTLQEPPLAEHQPELAIEEILFTEFIVQ
jgi:flagellar FliL protein